MTKETSQPEAWVNYCPETGSEPLKPACPVLRDILDLLYCVRACFPVKKTPWKSHPAMTLLLFLAQLLRDKFVGKKSSPALTPLKMHFTFDFTLDLQAISRTLNYAISQHLLFSSAFGESKF